MDSLDLLRRALQSGGGGATRDAATGDVILTASGIRIPGKTPTRLASGRKEGSWYTVEMLWFAVAQRHDNVSAYIKASREAGIDYLSLTHRQKVIQYLTGEASTVENLRPLSELQRHLMKQKPREQTQQRQAHAPEKAHEQKLETQAVSEAPKETVDIAARQERKKRKAECREQMAARLRAIREGMTLGAIAADDVAAGGDAGGVVGVSADKLADLGVEKLLKRQRIGDSLPEPRADAGLYREYINIDKPVVESMERTEHALCPREAVLNAEFGRVLSVDPKAAISQSHGGSSSSSASSVASSRSAAGATAAASGGRKTSSSSLPAGAPIIIVPSSLTAPVSLNNIKLFLERGIWTDPQKHSSSSHATHVEVMHEVHTADSVVTTHSVKIPFCVVDNVSKLRPADWDRVVAVFVIGAVWQFRDWKWKAANEVLSHMAGFYIKFDAEPLPPGIGTWNITLLKMSRNQRNLDADARRVFWNTVEKFIRQTKPHLCSL